MSRGPLERGIVISKVTNPVNPRDLPSEIIASLKECTIELEYLESGETYLFKTFKTGDNLDIRYKAEFEEGWYNLFEAYVAWWNEHNPADIYLIPEEEIIAKRKENEMEFTISKEQIKKRMTALETLRIAQINEIEKDLAAKKEDLAKGRPFNSTILGTSNLQQITLHISYLKDLLLAESITCSAQEKENIFKEFRVEKVMSQDFE